MIRKAITIFICLKGVVSAAEQKLLKNSTFLNRNLELLSTSPRNNLPAKWNRNLNNSWIYPKRVKAPVHVIIQENETVILIYNEFVKLFNSSGEEVECNITSNWPSEGSYPYENVKNEDNKWGLKIEGRKVPNIGELNRFRAVVHLSVGNRTYGSMRFEAIITRVVPHLNYDFEIIDYNPLKPWHFHIPEYTNFELPIDKNIFGENVQVSLKTQPNSSLTNIKIENKTDYAYVNFEGDMSELLNEINSPDAYSHHIATEIFFISIVKDTLNMPNFQIIKIYSFNHKLKTTTFEYSVRTNRFFAIHHIIKVNSTDFTIIAQTDFRTGKDGNMMTGIYQFSAEKASEHKQKQGEEKQLGNWYVRFNFYHIDQDFQHVSNIVLSTKTSRKYYFMALERLRINPQERIFEKQLLKSFVLMFSPLAVLPSMNVYEEQLTNRGLANMINQLYEENLLSFNVSYFGSGCIEVLQFSRTRSGLKHAWLKCASFQTFTSPGIDPNLLFLFYVKIRLDRSLKIIKAFREPLEFKNRDVESCLINDMILFADMKGYGIFMRGRDGDFCNIMKKDFMYQNMTEEEIAGSSYTLECFEDTIYAYLRIYNTKAEKYIFYLLEATKHWSNSRIKDINMLEDIGRVRPIINSPTFISFYLTNSNKFIVYTNLYKASQPTGSQPNDLSIESKQVLVMTVHNKYPKITFNTTVPTNEILTIYPYKENKIKVLVNITVTSVQKTEVSVIKNPKKLKTGVYNIDDFLNFKGGIQSIYIFNKTEKINILPRLACKGINMNVVSGCPFFIYHKEFVFCSSGIQTVYKDKVNNKKTILYKRSSFDSQSTLIGLAWHQLSAPTRLFFIIDSYKDKIYLIFYKQTFDPKTRITKIWSKSFTTISVPPKSIYLHQYQSQRLSFEHKINKYSDRYQGVIYLTTSSMFLSYGYNFIGDKLDLDEINVASNEMFGYGEYSGFIDSSVVSFSNYIPNIYESMAFFVFHGYIMTKQFSIDLQKPATPSLFVRRRFIFLKRGKMIDCSDVNYHHGQKMFTIKCLVVCDVLDAFIYTFRVKLKHSYQCEVAAIAQSQEGHSNRGSPSEVYFEGVRSSSLDHAENFDKNRVCATSPKISDIDSYFIPKGYTTKKISHGKVYFVIFCICEKSDTGELLIYKQGGPVGGDDDRATEPYVWASLFIPYQTDVNFELRYNRTSGKETLFLQENDGSLIFYDIQSMKLEIQDGSKAVEKLGIHIKNVKGEIAENSSSFNLTYHVEDSERGVSEQIQSINISLLVVAYACFVSGVVLISIFTIFYVLMIVGERLGYEHQRKFYSRFFISDAHLVFQQTTASK